MSDPDNDLSEVEEFAKILDQAQESYAEVCEQIMDAAEESGSPQVDPAIAEAWEKDLKKAVEAGHSRRTHQEGDRR